MTVGGQSRQQVPPRHGCARSTARGAEEEEEEDAQRHHSTNNPRSCPPARCCCVGCLPLEAARPPHGSWGRRTKPDPTARRALPSLGSWRGLLISAAPNLLRCCAGWGPAAPPPRARCPWHQGGQMRPCWSPEHTSLRHGWDGAVWECVAQGCPAPRGLCPKMQHLHPQLPELPSSGVPNWMQP